MIKEIATYWTARRQRDFSDREAVEGLQQHNRHMEDAFYMKVRRYFDEKFNDVFFDKDRKQEIFQSAFLKLWMEIDNRKIQVADGQICRQQRDGEYRPMTCSLTTFLMAFAKNEYRELVRSTKEEYAAEIFDRLNENAETGKSPLEDACHEEEQKMRIVDECIQQLSPRCVEVLTLFYYEQKSLDEIMELRKDKNVSKNGLKTSKNKCMNTLRERVQEEMKRYHIAV